MLRANGHYTAALKSRILGRHGHLSNVACAEALWMLYQSGVRHVVLGHLSHENNTPELARASAEEALFGFDAKTDVLPPETVKQYLINEDDLNKQISLEMLNEE
jgi:phosphoribosyl 1,2-cyclic phosphodiesterase